MLTVKEAAERLRTTETTIRRWIKAGKLRGRMPGGSKLGYLIVESDVLRLLPDSQARAENA
jgi:excisionase family DNA binding protein